MCLYPLKLFNFFTSPLLPEAVGKPHSICRLCMEHPTLLRTRSSFHGRVFEEFHFPQGWSSQALAQVSASHLGSGKPGWSNRVLAALVCPLSIGASTAPQDPSAWMSCRAWSPSPPDVGPATAGQGSISLSHGGDARLVKPALRCLSVPACKHSPKAQEKSPELFCSSEKQSSRGEGRAQSDPRCKLRGYGRTHIQGRPTLTACSVLQPLCAIVPQQ